MAQVTTDQAFDYAYQHHQAGRRKEAEGLYRQILAADPKHFNTVHMLGVLASQMQRTDEAVALFREAIALHPDAAGPHYNLGSVLQANGHFVDAFECYEQALARNPDFPEALTNKACLLKEFGQIPEAIRILRRCLEIRPHHLSAASNILLMMYYDPDVTREQILREHLHWYEQQARPLAAKIRPFPNDRAPAGVRGGRKLRVGYISPDYREHPVGRNMLPHFRHHDHSRFHVVNYAHVPKVDEVTEMYRSFSDDFRLTWGMPAEKIAEQVRADRIDVLVDLAVHSANHQLMVFAERPAPVQVTFAGYPGTTGVLPIRYRFSDPYLDPLGMNDAFYTEETIRLPRTNWCYEAFDSGLAVTELPAVRNGYITFGCLNNFCKVSSVSLAMWREILRVLPTARMKILCSPGEHRERALAALGVDAARIDFLPFTPRVQYLKQYQEIDICLDSFPYTGHTTGMESLWMGVPVVTLVGETAVSRGGFSLLSNLGMTYLAAMTHEEYVRIALQLAGDTERLGMLRRTLRGRMERSPLMDAKQFAVDIEEALLLVWDRWLAEDGGNRG